MILFLLDWVEEDFFQTHERKSTSQCRRDLFNGSIKNEERTSEQPGAYGGSFHHTAGGARKSLSISRFLIENTAF